jgi:alkylation response protein AidB-like acyl-CoA dehydrogenase
MLSDDQILIRDTARSFARERLKPRRDRAVAGRHLLDGERVGDVVGGGPAMLFGHQHAHGRMLSDDQILIRDTARSFARERLKPFSAEWDREALITVETAPSPAATSSMASA